MGINSFHWVRTTDRGWNGASNRVNIVEVNRNISGVDVIDVVGEHIPIFFNSGISYLTHGRVTPLNFRGEPILGDTTKMDVYWYGLRITMNTNMNVWGWGGVSPAVQRERATATFIHEVGHALKIAHPKCNCLSVMHSDFPNNAGGAAHVSPIVTVHDRNNLRQRWGL